jgi:dihydroneopterin aldolase
MSNQKTQATVELKNLVLPTHIGTYGPNDVVPDQHVLNLTLWIHPDLILIEEDHMRHVFDYDPLVRDIYQLAQDGHYETQERLLTRIVRACAVYNQIDSLDISLKKSPVMDQSGSLGMRLFVDSEVLKKMR